MGIRIARPLRKTPLKEISNEFNKASNHEDDLAQNNTNQLQRHRLNIALILDEFKMRANRIRQQKGTFALIKGFVSFLVYPFYKRTPYYLYEIRVTPEYSESEPRPVVDINQLAFQVVTSNQEADKLEKEGYKFRQHQTEFNHYQTLYTHWLDCGAIAFCTFVEKDFAAISWVLPSQKAQNAVKAPQLKVDYTNHEVIQRGMWVNPKFRGLQLYRYTVRNRDRYLSGKGVITLRATVDYSNKIGKGVDEAFGSIQYGKGLALKILWWKFWKETHYSE
jgi:hypothetical protein